jgi:hypothetical protein
MLRSDEFENTIEKDIETKATTGSQSSKSAPRLKKIRAKRIPDPRNKLNNESAELSLKHQHDSIDEPSSSPSPASPVDPVCINLTPSLFWQ